MELTGKCKEDFINWSDDHDISDSSILAQWHKVPNSMKFGFYEEFFDSKNIFISIESVFDRMLGYNRGFQVQIYQDGKNPITLFNEYQDAFNTRNESKIASIKKANELYNNQQ